eukprot:2101284-Amphidinium_carterae.1
MTCNALACWYFWNRPARRGDINTRMQSKRLGSKVSRPSVGILDQCICREPLLLCGLLIYTDLLANASLRCNNDCLHDGRE